MELQVYGKKLTDSRIDYYILQGRYGEDLRQRLIQSQAEKKRTNSSPRRPSAKTQLVIDLTNLLV